MNPIFKFTIVLFIFSMLASCKSDPKPSIALDSSSVANNFKFSLGQWSFHKDLFDGKMNTFDFIKKTKSLGFDGVDFVNQFFIDQAENKVFLDSIKQALNKHDLEAAMIMIDLEGDLGNPKQKERKQAVENHKKWVDAAQYIDCKVVRANAFGIGTSEEVMEACISSYRRYLYFQHQQLLEVLSYIGLLHQFDTRLSSVPFHDQNWRAVVLFLFSS